MFKRLVAAVRRCRKQPLRGEAGFQFRRRYFEIERRHFSNAQKASDFLFLILPSSFIIFPAHANRDSSHLSGNQIATRHDRKRQETGAFRPRGCGTKAANSSTWLGEDPHARRARGHQHPMAWRVPDANLPDRHARRKTGCNCRRVHKIPTGAPGAPNPPHSNHSRLISPSPLPSHWRSLCPLTSARLSLYPLRGPLPLARPRGAHRRGDCLFQLLELHWLYQVHSETRCQALFHVPVHPKAADRDSAHRADPVQASH